MAEQAAVIGHVVDHAAKLRILQRQRRRPTVPGRRLATGGRPHPRHQGIHAQVHRQWLLTVELPQGRQHEALGDAPLLRVDGADRHGTYAGGDPSTASRIA